MYIIFFFSVLISLLRINVAQDPIVQLPEGKIRGHILRSENGNPYYAFQEIPYAAPPVGLNRFQLPKKPASWSGILNTTENHVICYQVLPNYNVTFSEDCLYLNVYTPVAPGSSQRLPVLVWIHGGGFFWGSGTYRAASPKYIMDHGIVVVTLNYRLGNFGFLTTDDGVIPANLGLKDQLVALEWVNENIELFGGNSSHVTISGGSAGSLSVGTHLMGPWPNGKVLYHAAILESGSFVYYGRINYARQAAFELGRDINKTFSSDNSSELLKVLQGATPEQILEGTFIPPFPTLEKTGPFSYQMFETMVKGNFKKVPILIGSTSEEWLNEVLTNLRETANYLDKNPLEILDRQFNLTKVNRTIAVNLLKRIYTNTTFVENTPGFIKYMSDRYMSIPTTKQAELHSKFANVYLYQFSYKGLLGGSMNLANITGVEHVIHGEDARYFWSEGDYDLSKYPPEDQLMLHRYVRLWTNFVKYHNPTPFKDPMLQNITWTTINPKEPENISYLNVNKTLQMLSNPRNYQKVKKILDYYITPETII